MNIRLHFAKILFLLPSEKQRNSTLSQKFIEKKMLSFLTRYTCSQPFYQASFSVNGCSEMFKLATLEYYLSCCFKKRFLLSWYYYYYTLHEALNRISFALILFSTLYVLKLRICEFYNYPYIFWSSEPIWARKSKITMKKIVINIRR